VSRAGAPCPGHLERGRPRLRQARRERRIEQVEARRPPRRRVEPFGQAIDHGAEHVVELDHRVGEVMHRQPQKPVGAQGREVHLDAVLVAGVLRDGRSVPQAGDE
jgi:hypothetical protein